MTSKIKSTLTRTDNGGIEVIYTIPGSEIIKVKADVLKEFAQDANIPGFRKGKAPVAKVEEAVSEEKLAEHILNHILPEAFSNSVIEHKFNPALYPKFEAVKITTVKNISADGEWEIKAVTCEMPKITLPKDLKKKLKKDDKDQNVIIESLLSTVKVDVPKLLIEEEVNARLSQVLERIEKLGLALEGYLKSVGKTPESLRAEYEVQAKNSIAMELILNQIAKDQEIKVEESEITEFIKATGEDPTKVAEDQREILKRVILRRKALEKISEK